MNNNNLSLIEVAYREMKSKRRPRTLERIAKDVFEIKGIAPADAKKMKTQFALDFMLSGFFICCGEDKQGNKLWDLKNRQKSSLLDKDGAYLEDLYSHDEVIKHELKDDILFKAEKDFNDDDFDEDDEEETDVIEELLSEEYGDDDEEDDDEDDLDNYNEESEEE